MDCLDEPLHLEILTSLAANIARSTPPPNDSEDGAVKVLLDGLPAVDKVSSNGTTNGDDDEDDDQWSEFETNHAISYAHYVSSLPINSPYLGQALPRLQSILTSLLALSQVAGSDLSSPTSSTGTRREIDGLGSAAHAHLCESLLQAFLWVGWAQPELREEVAKTLNQLVERIGGMLKEDRSTTFPLVLLNCLHNVLSRCPMPLIPTEMLPALVDNITQIASNNNLVKMVRQTSSAYSTPGQPSKNDAFMGAHPTTPGGVVMLVAEITSIVLASAILPPPAPDHRVFANSPGTVLEEDHISHVSAHHIRELLAGPLPTGPEVKISSVTGGDAVLAHAMQSASRWWSEIMGVGHETEEIQRRGSLFTLGAGEVDDEVELSVAILHLMTMLSMHMAEPDRSQLTRLRLMLSEDSTASDPRILEAAFVCVSIIVRNHPDLGTSMTLHIRRLLMSPLPAFEGEMPCIGGDIPPAVAAASKCLAICIIMSANDDLVSSTLYSLLNTLGHGPTFSTGNAAPSIRSHPALSRQSNGDTATIKTGTSGKKTEEQRRLVAVTAVEVVSRLALEIARDDIIHLSISLLLQRLRGVDLMTEATIVTNLVPLALAGSNSDLVEVYRAFSQISRSSHPEDPRMTSNAVLAAQTTLAFGLGKQLNCADGYLIELLSLFAEKGTQTQMIAMAPTGFQSKDHEKLSHLRADSESRVADMKSWLAALLIPISTLLSHPNYDPGQKPTPELAALFRNFWFICVCFGLSGSAGNKNLGEHEIQALSAIAGKTPVLVLEGANDFVNSELEYNSIIRKDFAQSIQNTQRTNLAKYIPNHQKNGLDIRNLSTPQMTFLMAVYDLEEARTLRFLPSRILLYFANQSINESTLVHGLEAISQKLTSVFLKQLSHQVVIHAMPACVPTEVCKILVACTHRFRKVRQVALSYAREILETFSALMCDRHVVFTLLEILTIMRRSCEFQYTDEYSPTYEFSSDKMDLTLELTDDYAVRNEVTTQLRTVAENWLKLAISRAPIEVQSTLQSYLNESKDVLLIDSVEMGAGLALHYSKSISKLDRQESAMPNIGGWASDCSNLVASQFAAKNYFNGELSGYRHVLQQGLQNLQSDSPAFSSAEQLTAFKSQMAEAVMDIKRKVKPFGATEIRRILFRAAAVLVASPKLDNDVIHYLVELPMTAFTPLAIAAGVDAWTYILRQRPESQVSVIGEITAGWLETVRAKKGLFSTSMNYHDPFTHPIEYAPTNKQIMDLEKAKAGRLLNPHLLLIKVLSSQFQAVKYRESGITMSLIRMMMRSLVSAKQMSTHALAREVRFSLLLFGFQMLASSKMEALLELRFRDRLFAAAFQWFSVRPQWSFGSDRIQVFAEIRLLQDFLAAISQDQIRGDHSTSSFLDRPPAFLIRGSTSLQDYALQHKDRVKILSLLVENEISRLIVWGNPVGEPGRTPAPGALEKGVGSEEWTRLIKRSWRLSPSMAVHMGERFKYSIVQSELTRLVRTDPKAVLGVPEALHYLLGDRLETSSRAALKWLPVWAAVPPVNALVYFSPRYGNHPLILQYAMRVLEQHPVDLTFFFVPQVVQALRTDGLGYVERFIFETSKISQLFCHQIIWNMKANTFRDDNATEPDPMKPLLDRMIDMIVAGLSGKAGAFYETEFNFFDAVTSISGKLRPFIKKSKPEKKAKIDEEMAKIELSVGVYLPSNPDGVVIDLDRKSGRPLQSHAKAPFMATFKVQKERIDLPADSNIDIADEANLSKTKYDVWVSAIFKVGDDCRQDVLALQIIAMFKNVFTSIGLVLYLFPYRVTATAPGCGVIDVVPNATSRDEMGRAKINDLFSYFVDKYGGVDTVSFQKARLNFIQSMAAYSVACYILQIKDRHNGNIMIDGDGHIVHIDFGFLFDIDKFSLLPEETADRVRPGGIKFEPNSFKLNHEMVALMGGRDSQGYKMFTELTIKAFLAIRPHAEQLIDACHLMLETALPSFKGEGTITRLRDRFQLQLGERAAAEYMMGVIRNAHENMRSNVYDGFQKLQNGIPY